MSSSDGWTPRRAVLIARRPGEPGRARRGPSAPTRRRYLKGTPGTRPSEPAPRSRSGRTEERAIRRALDEGERQVPQQNSEVDQQVHRVDGMPRPAIGPGRRRQFPRRRLHAEAAAVGTRAATGSAARRPARGPTRRRAARVPESSDPVVAVAGGVRKEQHDPEGVRIGHQAGPPAGTPISTAAGSRSRGHEQLLRMAGRMSSPNSGRGCTDSPRWR